MALRFVLLIKRLNEVKVLISAYFQLGFSHILDFQGYDHMLFLILLLSQIEFSKWKEIIALITAFTIGHSITLAFVVLEAPIIRASLVEFLIPITIFLTGLNNLIGNSRAVYTKTFITSVFGLIHGMGFAGYLSSLMPSYSSPLIPLIFFNLGVEAGQLIFAFIFLSLMFALRFTSKNTIHITQIAISVVGMAISLFLASSNWPF